MEKRKTGWWKQGTRMQSFIALLEHFPKSIFYVLYTISKLRKFRIQQFKPCTIWSWNEEDRAFRRQLHQVEGQFRTMEIKVRIPQSKVWEFRTPETKVRNWNCNVRKLDIFLQIFLYNFHFLLVFSHSCNSLARKYPRKGKITFLYKFSCKHWRGLSEAFSRRPTDVNSTLRIYTEFFLLSFSLYYFLFSWKPNSLWGCFPRGWEAKLIVS